MTLQASRVASERLSIIVSGMLAAVPGQGGATWAVLQYLLGLRQLGHEVYFIEPVDPAAVQPNGAPLGRSSNAEYLHAVAHRFALADRATLLLAGSRETVGLPYGQLLDLARGADLLLNISGLLTDPALLDPIPIRAYLDLDPAFNQLWQAVEGIDMRFDAHTHFVTVGLALGQPDCPVPTCGRDWITTLQPIVLERWPVANEPPCYDLTTIANWRGYGSIEHNGVFYGQKAHSLRPLIDLPRRTDRRFELALAIHPDETRDLAALAANGWRLLEPSQVAGSPDRYQRFVQSSWAEFGLAKSGYVATRCGWFSDRSVCYLASGRPVIAQDTGFGPYLPTGAGLLTFASGDQAVAAIQQLEADYPRHAAAARTLAEELFDSDRVLQRLLARLGLPA